MIRIQKQPVDVDVLKAKLEAVTVPVLRGEVTAAREGILTASLPGAMVGTRVVITPKAAPPVVAEAVSFNGPEVMLLPLTPPKGVGPGARLRTTPSQNDIPCGPGLLGRVVSCLGTPLDSGPAIANTVRWPLDREAPDPLSREPITEQLSTGIRALDGCLGIGLGQRIGLFAGPGLGKSTLLGMLAKQAESDVNVICLVGERGREVGEFLDSSLGDAGRRRSVVVLAGVDAPPLNRVRALNAATSIAEWFRLEGQHVLLLVDSLTRVVRAKREVAFSMGETVSRGGFPPSAFLGLPSLIERTGRSSTGSITAVYTVLTEGRAGDPVAEEARSLLDGHILLSEKLARRGLWPAVDLLGSVSRVAESIFSAEQLEAAQMLKRLVSAYEEHEDLILMGAYRPGTSRDTDLAIEKKHAIETFLAQKRDETSLPEETFLALKKLLAT
jgi:type III secretion protein N (ATPase)